MTTESTQIQEQIQKEIGVEIPEALGYKIVLQVYLRPEKVGGILLPEMTRDSEKYRSKVGRVVAMGPDAFKGSRFPSGPWCKIGDWVTFPSNAGTSDVYDGIHFHSLDDDQIKLKVKDPSKVGLK